VKKISLLVVAAVAGLAALAGCANAPALPTLQQQFVQMCPVVNADLAVLAASPSLTVAQQDTLKTQIIPANQLICSTGAALNVTSLKAFHDSLLPVAIGIVQATPAIPNQPLVLLALQLFGPVVQGLIDQAITTVAPAAPAVPASAPVATSI
jgi:outer membrane murein-binding lipoprotein Lpp